MGAPARVVRSDVAVHLSGKRIAVEVKSFLGDSPMRDLELALGQFLLYRSILEEQEFDRALFLAIPNQAAAIQAVALGGFLLVFLLSGLIFPVENIPAGLRWVSSIVWGRYYIEIVRDALLKGGGWPAVWFAVLMIGVIGAAFYLLTWRKMRAMQLKV